MICAHVMVNLLRRRSIWRPLLIVMYSGLSPCAGRGYDTVSTSSLYDPTRLKTDSGVLFFVVVVFRGGPDRYTSVFNLYVLSGSRWVIHLCKFCSLQYVVK